MTPDKLRERIMLERPVTTDDGLSRSATSFEDVAEMRANYLRNTGGEAVIAKRLEGQQPTVVTIRRQSRHGRDIRAGWRLRDLQTGERFNVLEIRSTPDLEWLEMLTIGGEARP